MISSISVPDLLASTSSESYQIAGFESPRDTDLAARSFADQRKGDGRADGCKLSSDNVRKQPPFERGAFGSIRAKRHAKTLEFLAFCRRLWFRPGGARTISRQAIA